MTLAYEDIRVRDELYDEATETYHRVESIDDDELTWVAVAAPRGDSVRDRQPGTRETVNRATIEAGLSAGTLGRPDDDPIPLDEETLRILDDGGRYRDVAALAEAIRESSAARGVDQWATEHIGLSAAAWARMTDRDRSTVATNARRGRRE